MTYKYSDEGDTSVYTVTASDQDGRIFTWQNGRELATYADGTNSVSYSYDAGGMRTAKAVTKGTTTDNYKYIYENGLLMQMRCNNIILDFTYGADGRPIGFAYRASVASTPAYYYYALNSRGDVIGLYNSSGALIVNYKYDAYGKLLGITNSSGSTITAKYSYGVLNPLRYRSYVYDRETGLYYLQTRYYDPTTCRFINADRFISSIGTTTQGYNMFAYCFNNPVNLSDTSGNWPKWVENTFNWVNDNIVKPVTNFVNNVADDIKKYDKNNTDVNKVYEANYISAYKGENVILISNDFLTSVAFAGTIFLNHSDDHDSLPRKTETINHEYGHIQQEKDLGTFKYLAAVGLPSITCNLLARNNDFIQKNYYNMPWEYNADMRGGVNRGYSDWAKITSDTYFFLLEVM